MKIAAIIVGGIIALFVGSAVVAGVIESTGSGEDEESASRGKSGAVGKPDGYVRVRRVIDGDSVVFTRFGETRLIGANAPEEGRCYETAATAFAKSRLEGKRVGYEFDKDREDRYGRTLAYLYREGMHNLALVEEGYAKAMTVPPNDKYASEFRDAERNAKEQKAVLWSGECERRRRAAREEQGRRGRQARDADGDGKVDDAPKSDSGSGGGGSGGGSSGNGDSGGGGEDSFDNPLVPGD